MCSTECQRLKDEVERLRWNPLPTPPAPKDDRFFYISSGNSSSSDLVSRPGWSSTIHTPASINAALVKDEPLLLSSVPTTPALTEDEVFDALSTDIETERESAPNPHRRSAPPAPRRPTTTSDDLSIAGLSRSVPRHPEPFSPKRPTRERSYTHSGARRLQSPVRRRTADDLEPHERVRGHLNDLRGQLAELLDQPQPTPSMDTRPGLPRTRSSQSVQILNASTEQPRRRKMSVPDALPMNCDPPPPPPPPPPPVRTISPPPVLVHASSAAWAAERLRTEAAAHKPMSTRPAYGTPLRDVTTLAGISSPLLRGSRR
jgi:hypothetical protein